MDTRSSTEKVDLEEFHFRGLTLNRRNSRKARVLYDYDKAQEDEISVTAEQVGICVGECHVWTTISLFPLLQYVTAYPVPGNDEYFIVVIGEGSDKIGKVPLTYLELF